MPPNTNPFPHISFEVVRAGRARLNGFNERSDKTKRILENRPSHVDHINKRLNGLKAKWNKVDRIRKDLGLPELPLGRPLLLVVDENIDIDFLRSSFGLEIVAEEESGYVLAASRDENLTKLQEKLNRFLQHQYGGATAAQLHEIVETTEDRLARVLDDFLYARWPAICDTQWLVVDISISCSGDAKLPDFEANKPNETETHYKKRYLRHIECHREAFARIDAIQTERESKLRQDILETGGKVYEVAQQANLSVFSLPDSFTVRARVSGLFLKDLAANHPHLFKIETPDVKEVFFPSIQSEPGRADQMIHAPSNDASTVCIIDSGIQEEHRLLRPAVLKDHSKCFIPGEAENDTADYVEPRGHGTRVAGAVLYPQGIPATDSVKLPCWIHNARVLDKKNNLPKELLPALYMERIVNQYSAPGQDRPARIFNHSINSKAPARRTHMSTWGASIDELSYKKDILVIQSTGNVADGDVAYHLNKGKQYPDYQLEPFCRLSNPAQSLNALTVGSVAHADWRNERRRSIAGPHKPSAFSRSGEGIWNSVKPEVVEYGGDYIFEKCQPVRVMCNAHVAPELVGSTMYGQPAVSKDDVGTSFATPKVSHIAALLENELPQEPCLLYRALIANSARWPEWAEKTDDKCSVLKRIGYGIPSPERATRNDDYRITLISSGELPARTAHLYHVPVPASLQSPENNFLIRIDITLSYAALPRRTRKGTKSYLSTWLDWDVCKSGESRDAFQRHIFYDSTKSKREPGQIFDWHLRDNESRGEIKGFSRQASTLQKDWCYVDSNELPEDFYISVVGHPGWDPSPESPAKYSLAVSFEAVNCDIKVYEYIRAEVEKSQIAIESRERIQIQETELDIP